MPIFFVRINWFQAKCQRCDNLLDPKVRLNYNHFRSGPRKAICVKAEVADGWRCVAKCPSWGGENKGSFESKFLLPTGSTLIIDEDYLERIVQKRISKVNPIRENLFVCPRCGYTTAPAIKVEPPLAT